MNRNILTAGLITVALSACAQQAPPALTALRGGGARLEAQLHARPGFSAAHGQATYKNRGGEREFQLEVENLRALRGSTLGVFVSGARVGGARVNRFGSGRVELNSERGGRVPSVRSGTRVDVKTPAGKAVVTGSF